jgi:hypothetical protein
MRVVNLKEWKEKHYPDYLTVDELDILRQIDEQKDIMFTDEELENALVLPEFEGK